MSQYQGIIGLFGLITIAWLISEQRHGFRWQVAVAGLALQFVIALLMLKLPQSRAAFSILNEGVLAPVDLILPPCLLNPPMASPLEDSPAPLERETSRNQVGFRFWAFGFWLLFQFKEIFSHRKPKTKNQKPKAQSLIQPKISPIIKISFNKNF